jgi:hypothetical protein
MLRPRSDTVDETREAMNREQTQILTDGQIVTERKVARRSFLAAAGTVLAGGALALASAARAGAQAQEPEKKDDDADKKKEASSKSSKKSKKAKSEKGTDADKAKEKPATPPKDEDQ